VLALSVMPYQLAHYTAQNLSHLKLAFTHNIG